MQYHDYAHRPGCERNRRLASTDGPGEAYLYPPPTPHEFVDLESRDEKGNCVPVLVANENCIKSSSPLICDIFSLAVFSVNREVNVMPNLVEENLAENNVPQDGDTKRSSLQSADDLVDSKLDVG